MEQLREKGSVTRGWLGVQIQAVTPELAESLDLPDTKGALIAGVFKGDPADEGGIEVGDVVIEFDGSAVESDRELVTFVGNTAVGRKVTVKVFRDGKEETLEVKVAERTDGVEGAVGAGEGSEDLQPFELGIKVQDLTKELAERFGLEDAKGILVTEVDAGGTADKAGLNRGDIIVEVNRKAVSNIQDFRKVLKEAGKGESLLFLVQRGKGSLFIAVKPEKKKD